VGVSNFEESYDLICFSHLRWDWVYQRPQHLMSRCARERRIFFIEEPVFDAEVPHLAESERMGVRVVVPHLPLACSDSAVAGVLQSLLDAFLADQRVVYFVLWYYTPMALEFTRHLNPLAVIYDCMDELSAFSAAPPELAAREVELLQRADLVFAGGRSLYEAKRIQHPSVHAFPSGVDVCHFAQALLPHDEPADQATIPHPRLGFCGVLDERLDADLLTNLAAARPDWHFVMIGPATKIQPDDLPMAANIHYLGQKSYGELPAYLAGWDVALLPFARNGATRYISPTKTPEYLAAGLPVVSTAIHDVVHPYGTLGMVHIADTVEEWVAALEAALTEELDRERIEAFLQFTTWDRTWQSMQEMVDGLIDYRSTKMITSSVTIADHVGFDYLIVGAGFAGSVAAERLAREAGKRVLLIDRRPHVGGNAYDYFDDAGILVHKYGPHIFHTNSSRVFEYLSQFTDWRPYQHRVRALVDGRLLPIPINLDTVNELYGLSLTSFQVEEFFNSIREHVEYVRSSEDVVVSTVGRDLYKKFFRGYTRKQWGVDPSELDAAVTARIPTRTNRDDRYFTDTYQAMPLHGYTRMFEHMLDHPNIKIMLNTDYRDIVGLVPYGAMIYTGPIDEYFEYRYGTLPYRSLAFELRTFDTPTYQPYPVINYPNDYAYTRVTEFKYLTGQEHTKTTIVTEYPREVGDPYYPVPRPENATLYARYRSLAERLPHIHFVGRLATYKYYNMDQVVAQALATVERIIRSDVPGLCIEIETRLVRGNSES
jgi:UDP-galactopyranose mutase